MAAKRLNMERVELTKNPSECYSAEPEDEKNLLHWIATVFGPVRYHLTNWNRKALLTKEVFFK